MFRTVPLSIIRSSSLYTQQWYMSYRFADSYMFRTVPLSIIRSFSLYTQQWYMSYRFADSYMFRTVPLSIIRSFSLYTQQWYMSYSFADSLLTSFQQTCMTYTIAACTVKNSLWWTEEMSETCRVLFQEINLSN